MNCPKRRHRKQAKDADRLEPKGSVDRSRVCPFTLAQTLYPPAQRQNLLDPGMHTERGKPVVLPKGTANRKDGLWECGQRKTEKAKAACNEVDRDDVERQHDPARKRADFRLVFLDEKT
ncbi:hypothetical protein [Ktedonobacter sp. SOSP1-52]|uniref:hypothetical protein n=1 Tax=Ktedonobacter sp. SOSP1-52 TaxID=2778366 RepID=UPI00191555B9|nr:hypothetical protein [Ktedonobacter sp. SOSP1-52]